MVLDNKTTEAIKSLVYQKPRSINNVAHAIGKNWRTADRYVDQIKLQTGTIKTITFREGTRGALKIVYWNNTEKIYATDIQEKLFKQVELGVEKSDFSPFEIYQYVDPAAREAYYEEVANEKNYDYNVKSLAPHFKSAEKEVCIFAGNLALIHLKHRGKTIFKYIEECVKRKVLVKIITNINIIDLDNVERILSLNTGLRESLVEVRHDITPLRAYIFDDTLVKLGEIDKGQQKTGQVNKTLAVYYEIRDKAWIEWMQKLFWKKFQNAVHSNIRLDNFKSLRKIK